MLWVFEVCSKVAQFYVYTHTHTHTHVFFFRFFSIVDYYKVLNIVPCAIWVLNCLSVLYIISIVCTY